MILQILPTTPPEANGLADYARKLQRNWPDSNESWSALALRVPDDARERWPRVAISPVLADPASLVAALEAAAPRCVVLHYVPYAYDRSGVPTWLAEGLETWRRTSRAGLFEIHHELYVWARPWQRARLYVPASKRCFRRIAGLADGWITSNERYFSEACEEGADPASGGVVPIGSNIECVAQAWARQKEPGLVAVFGLPSSRGRAVATHKRLLESLAAAGVARALLVLGASPSPTERAHFMAAIPKGLVGKVTELFDASEEQISAELGGADYGLCAVPASTITRSGVYAALCAHGVIPVVSGRAGPGSPPFVANDDERPEEAAAILSNKSRAEAVRNGILNWSATTGSWDSIARDIHSRVEATCAGKGAESISGL